MKTHCFLNLLIILCTTASAYPNSTYDLIDLGTTQGDIRIPSSINDSGQVVGYTYTIGSNIIHAVLFDSTGNGNNIDLGSLGGIWSYTSSINNHGQIVGRSQTTSGHWRATLFDSTGAGNNIALGGDETAAYSINNQGKIVGDWGGRATLFDESGNENNIILSTFASHANAINDNDQIVGTTELCATLFDVTGNGNNIILSHRDSSLGVSEAYSLNNAGQIVGYDRVLFDRYYIPHAFLFDPTGNGNNIDLDPFSGGSSFAYAINDFGQIVGTREGFGMLFDSTGNGNNIDLNTLISDSALYNIDRAGWVIDSAVGINNNGWITAIAYYYDFNTELQGDYHAILLQPADTDTVPEPATVALIVLGAMALRSRKK